jgi:hypothetical protein
VTTYKQADLTLTGTMRKAQLAATATKTSRRPAGPTHADSPIPSMLEMKRRASSISTLSHLLHPMDEKVKECDKCHVKFSPRWWPAGIIAGPDEDKLLCHKCHWNIIRGAGNGEGLSGGSTNGINDTFPNGMDRIQDPRVEIIV